MIKGALKWDQKDAYYVQTNNPTEALLRAKDDTSWLESCGPTAAVNCLAARGCNLVIKTPGTYRPQPEEVLMDFFNDPRNKRKLNGVRVIGDDIPENRVPQFYPLAVFSVFGVRSRFKWGLTFGDVVARVSGGSPVQVCLKNPGHYIAVVAYDDVEHVLIYNDSWPERFADKNGFNREMTIEDFSSNVQSYFIIYDNI